MSTITVRLNQDEAVIYKEYAEFKNVALSTLMKEALQEKIEDEIDMKAISEYEADVEKNCVEVYDHTEVRKMLGLWYEV